jgi:cell wall-associated NlpC family hydrolase
MAAGLAVAPAETRAEIVRVARGFLGTRFRHQGRTAEGLDCAGLVIAVGQAAGVLPDVVEVPNYGRRADGTTLIATCRANLLQIPTSTIAVGDVCVFLVDGDPQHLGIVGDHPAGGLSVIHAFVTCRKVVENRLDALGKMRLVAAFRYPGVETD